MSLNPFEYFRTKLSDGLWALNTKLHKSDGAIDDDNPFPVKQTGSIDVDRINQQKQTGSYIGNWVEPYDEEYTGIVAKLGLYQDYVLQTVIEVLGSSASGGIKDVDVDGYGNAYFVYESNLVKVNQSGNVLWDADLNTDVHSVCIPKLTADRSYVFVGDSNGEIYKINQRDGELESSENVGNDMIADLVAYTEENVFAACWDNNVYGVDFGGDDDWSQELNGRVRAIDLKFDRDYVIAGTDEGKLYNLDVDNGNIEDETDFDSEYTADIYDLIVNQRAEHTYAVARGEGHVKRFNIGLTESDWGQYVGTDIWSIAINGHSSHDNVIIYVGVGGQDSANKLHALTEANGELYNLELSGGRINNSVLDKSGFLFIVSRDGSLRKIFPEKQIKGHKTVGE